MVNIIFLENIFEFIINTALPAQKASPAEYHGNSTLNIIIIPLNVLLGSVAQWSRSRPSVKMVHVLLSAKLFYLCCIIFFRFFFVFVFNHIFPLACFPLFLLLFNYSLSGFLQ